MADFTTTPEDMKSLVAELQAAIVRRKPLEYQSFPCLVVRQTRKQKVPDNVPVELASFVDESKDDA